VAWKNGYYYRNRREGKRVISEYIGAGPVAGLVAQLDAHERARIAAERDAWQALKDEQTAIDAPLDAIGAQLEQFVMATLLVSGHHLHRGQWRKMRHAPDD